MDPVAFLGRLHPLVLHLPIGALFTILVVEMWLLRSRSSKNQWLLFILYFFASMTALLAMATGLVLHEEDVYGGSTLDLHEQLGIATGFATLLVTWFAFKAGRFDEDRVERNRWINLRQLGLVISLGLITLAGHFGGELTHGSEFLTEHGPAFLREKEEEVVVEITAETTVFEAAIYPILDNYCVYCHNAEKTKGKLRMDSPEKMLAGGKSGALFVAGDPENSLMLERIHLPLEHEDHMPPPKKDQPGEEEIAALVWWIENGASFERPLSDPEVPDSIRSLVPQPDEEKEELVFAGELDLEVVQSLRDQLLTIQRIQQGDDRLWINFSAIATTAGDEFLEQLKPLSPFIAWLNLSRTQITDASMSMIANMPNLEDLNLNSCQITDAGLEELKGHPQLKKLNLTQTSVSDSSLPTIITLESLEVVHLYQSEWSPEAVKVLKNIRPDLTVNFGE